MSSNAWGNLLQPETDSRRAAIRSVLSTPGLDPDDVIDDYGDHDCDYSPQHHDIHNGIRRTSKGIVTEDVTKFYDSCRQQDITIKEREDN